MSNQLTTPLSHFSLLASKVLAISKYNFPSISRVTFFLILFSKQYRKKLLLIYIIINLFFSVSHINKTQAIEHYYFLKFSSKANFLFSFLFNL